jgi:Protein of unknown function (DUF3592)
MTFQPNQSPWQPPDGLGRSSQRPVRLAAGGIALAVLGILFAIGGPVLGAFLATKSRNEAARNASLHEEGVETSAVVTRVWRDGGKENRRMVAYRFSAGDRELIGHSSPPRDIWDTLHEGDPLPIRYVPGKPEINHPTGWETPPMPTWLPWLMAGMFIWPGIMFWSMIRRQSWLLAEGRPTPGTVTAIRRGKQVAAVYEFKLLSGEVHKGRAMVNRPIPTVGDRVCVLYDPDNPRRNALYPLQLVKLDKD